MATILVTGADGQLGNALQTLAKQHLQHQFLFANKTILDITSEAAVQQFVQQHAPQFIINCAAYTAVDKAEADREMAFFINETAVAHLARSAALAGAKLIHISTDYVFDGKGSKPYSEDAATAPLSVYGASKLGGEQACLQYAPNDSIIIRTSWVYDSSSHNFVNTMLRLMSSGKDVSVVADQWGSPTYAPDLAEAILCVINHTFWQPGIYHYTNEGAITWFEFASAIQQKTGFPVTVKPINTAGYPTPATRPAYSVLSKEKIVNHYGAVLKPWDESLTYCLHRKGVLRAT